MSKVDVQSVRAAVETSTSMSSVNIRVSTTEFLPPAHKQSQEVVENQDFRRLGERDRAPHETDISDARRGYCM